MKNFLYLLFHFKLKELFVDDTNDGFIQFFRFCFVGGAATIVDMAVGVIFRNILPHDFILNLGLFTLSLDAVSGAFGFIAGLVTNYFIRCYGSFGQTYCKGKQYSLYCKKGHSHPCYYDLELCR